MNVARKAQSANRMRVRAVVSVAATALVLTAAFPPPVVRATEPADASGFLQGPSHDPVVSGAGLSVPLAQAWTHAFPGQVSSAVGGDGRIFVEFAIANGTHLVALDASTGAELWSIDLGGGWSNSDGAGQGAPSVVAYVDGRVFATTAVSTLAAYDGATGGLLWDTRTTIGVSGGDILATPGALYAMGRTGIEALDPTDGSQLWSSAIGGWLAADDGVVVGSPGCGNAFGLDQATGDVLWRWTEGTCPAAPTDPIVAAAGRVDLTAGGSGQELDIHTGHLVGTYDSDVTPVIDGGTTLLRSGSVVRAVDSSSKTTRWSFSGDGALDGHAFVADGVVYVGSRAGSLYGLDEATGTVRWQHGLPAGVEPPGYAAAISTVAGLLLVPAGSTLTAFRSASATPPPPLPPVPPPPYTPPPLTSGDATAFQIDARHDGQAPGPAPTFPLHRLWSVRLGWHIPYPLFVDGKVVITAKKPRSAKQYLHAYEERTGVESWAPLLLTGRGEDLGGIAADGGRVYVSGDGPGDRPGFVQAIDVRTGTRLWTVRLPEYLECQGCHQAWSFFGPPTAVGGRVYVTGSGKGSITYALDGATGRLIWMAPMDDGNGGTPTVTSNAVVVASPCNLVSFDRATGRPRWGVTTGCTGGGGPIVAASRGRLFFRNSRVSVVLGAADGSPHGLFTTRAIPAVSGRRSILVADGYVYAEDVPTGRVVWTFGGADHIVTAPILLGGVALVGSDAGRLFAIDVGTGDVLWETSAGGPIIPGEVWSDPLGGLAAAHGLVAVPATNMLTIFSSS